MNKTSIKSHGSTNTSTHARTLDRTDSSVTKLCDLHVYKVPPELWRHNLNNVLNNAITDTVSVGIIRVPEELRLNEVRSEVSQQLAIHGVDLVPRDYVFLRSVGRSLTTLRGQQEHQLKAKHFLPPVAYAPELYILEATPEVRAALASSDASSSPLSQRASPSHRALPPSHRTGYRGNPASQGGDQSHQSVHTSRYGYKPTPRSMDTPARGFSAHFSFQSSPNNYSLSRSSELHINSHSTHNNPHSTHINPHSTHDTNNPHNTHNPHSSYNNAHNTHNTNNAHNSNSPFSLNDTNNLHNENNNPQNTPNDKDNPHNDKDNPHNHNNNPHNHNAHNHNNNAHNNTMLRYQVDRVTRRKQFQETCNDTSENDWGGQATHRQTTHTSHRQSPHTQATHRQLPHTGSPDVSSDNQRQHWSADNGGDSPDGSRAGGWSQDDPYGRRYRGQDGGMSRHARGNDSDRLDSENDSEDERGGHRGRGGARHSHKAHHGHSDEDEPGMSSEDEPGTRNRRQKLGQEKNHLQKSLDETRMSRQEQEKERADLMRKAKHIRHKTTQYRNEARDLWKKKYFEEKKRTAPLEDTSNMLQAELEALHGRQMSLLEGPRDKSLRIVDGGPSDKSNHVIQCAKLRHEIEGVSRRVELARMKLTSEMKLRVQAQAEMKAVRSEAMHKRLASRIPRASHRNTTVMTAAK